MAYPVTPKSDREFIKKMGHSLRAFSKHKTLTKMTKEQLADLPKEIMISCAANEIALVWDKLPIHLREDIDILKYQYCLEHYNKDYGPDENVDVNDGPVPRKLFCCYCNVHDVTVASDNNVSANIVIPPPNSRKRLPLNCCCNHQ